MVQSFVSLSDATVDSRFGLQVSMFTVLAKLNAHSLGEPIVDVQVHPEGNRLAVCTQTGSVRLFSFPDLKCIGESELGSARRVCWSPDGSFAAASRDDGELVLLDASTWKIARQVSSPNIWRIQNLAFSPDGARLAAVGRVEPTGERSAGVLKVWDLETEAEVGEISTQVRPTARPAFHPEGTTLIIAGGGIATWNTQDWTVSRLEAFVQPVCDFTSDASRLVAVCRSQAIELYDLQTSAREAIYDRFIFGPTALAWSPDLRHFAAGYADGSLYLWDSERDVPLALACTGSSIAALCFSPDDQQLALGNESGEISIWNVADRRQTPDDPPRSPERLESESIKALRSPATAFFSPDGNRLISGGSDDYVRVWDAASGERYWSARTDYWPAPCCTPDGKSVVAQFDAETLRQWKIEDKEIVGEFVLPDRQKVTGIAFAAGGDRMISTGHTSGVHGRLYVWDVESRQVVHRGDCSVPIFALHLNQESDRIYVGTGRSVQMWDAASADLLAEVVIGAVTRVVCSKELETVFTISSNVAHHGEIRCWDAELRFQGAILATGSRKAVLCLAISPDGRTLASGGNDNLVRLWDARSKEPKAVLRGHASEVISIDFSPDGQTIATGSRDKTLKLWDVSGV